MTQSKEKTGYNCSSTERANLEKKITAISSDFFYFAIEIKKALKI